MPSGTVKKLQDLIYSLKNSIDHHRAAAEKVNQPTVADMFRDLAKERESIMETIGGFVTLTDKTPDESSSILGKMKACWTSFRASLNGGNTMVVLIEAERAEDSLMAQFNDVLPAIAGNPINDRMLDFFVKIKSGHDRVLALRNKHQANA